jgi:outer membrane immunogenic protein
MKRLLAALAITIFGLTGAQAADLAARPYTKAPVPVAAIYDWTGFYVGGNVGYGWGEGGDPGLSVNDGGGAGLGAFLTTGFPGFPSGNLYPNLKPNGVFGGLQVGYDRQLGSWVIGAVADIQAADFKASRTVATPTSTCCNVDESLSAKINWFGTVRGKVGFAANDWLFYGTGGLAYGEAKSTLGLSCTPGGVGCAGATIGFAGSQSETKVGWSAGAGISKAFGNWNVGVEYLHIDLGRSSVTATSTTGFFTATTVTASQRFIEEMARVTVNYKFGNTAVVAKY